MVTVYARLQPAWPVLGLQGQRLGTVERCAIDIAEGVVRSLELKTAWQTIDIDWLGLEFDEDEQVFKLLPPHSTRQD